MRKILTSLFIVLSLVSVANASSEDATLTDIKESLAYLITQYKVLVKKQNLSQKNINQIKINDKNSDLKIDTNKNNIKILQKKLSEINSKISFEKSKKSKDDEIIDTFVKSKQ